MTHAQYDPPVLPALSNFEFLATREERLARLARLAERYFLDDPAGALLKLRSFAELMAKEIAARNAVLPPSSPSFDQVLSVLRQRGLLPREAADLFYHLKRIGNAAAHEDAGSPQQALAALKFAHALAIWFHRGYGGVANFTGGPFVPPRPPVDASIEFRKELGELRAAVTTSRDAEAKARLVAMEAKAARVTALELAGQREEERAFWQDYAAETEAGQRAAKQALAAMQAAAEAAPSTSLDLLAAAAARAADDIVLDERATRVLIDDQLRLAGWDVDSVSMRYANGTRPEYGRAMAIAEWPTKSGPVDYALFVDGRCLGVIEAKRGAVDVPGRLGQAQRYARDITIDIDALPPRGPWMDEDARYRVPFMFATNGRAYVKQLATKSGIWFWNARTGEAPRPLAEWFSPRDLEERLEQQVGDDIRAVADCELGVTGLRPYQDQAIDAVDEAIGRGQRSILLAMATGTGKTRLAIALMYQLLRQQRFRRILFLVDRNALGRQTLDAMATTDTSGFLKFSEVFPVADLATKFPEATTRVQVATV